MDFSQKKIRVTNISTYKITQKIVYLEKKNYKTKKELQLKKLNLHLIK